MREARTSAAGAARSPRSGAGLIRCEKQGRRLRAQPAAREAAQDSYGARSKDVGMRAQPAAREAAQDSYGARSKDVGCGRSPQPAKRRRTHTVDALAEQRPMVRKESVGITKPARRTHTVREADVGCGRSPQPAIGGPFTRLPGPPAAPILREGRHRRALEHLLEVRCAQRPMLRNVGITRPAEVSAGVDRPMRLRSSREPRSIPETRW